MKNTVTSESHFYGVLITLLLSTFMATLAISSTNILLPKLVISLHTTFANVQWVSISYLISLSSTLVIAGKLSDIYGKQKLFICGITIFTTSAVMCGFSNNIWLLTAFRGLQGIGAATIIAVNLAMITELFPAQKVASVMGLLGSMSAIGTASGPIIGGLAAQWIDWHAVFLINLPLGLTVLIMAKRHLPAHNISHNRQQTFFDFQGALLLSLTIFSYALSLKLSTVAPVLVSLTLGGFAGLFLVLFITTLGASNASILEISILQDMRYSLGFTINFIVSTVVMTSLVISPFYLTIAFNLSLTETGLVMACSPVVVAMTSTIIGRTLRDNQQSMTVTMGVTLLGIGTSCLAQFNVSFGIIGYICCLAITAVGYGIFTSSNNTQIMKLAATHHRGQVSGLLNLSRNLGLLTGATLMSGLFELAFQSTSTHLSQTTAVEQGLNRVYAFATLLLIIALVLRVLLHKREQIKN